jgi:hypothetical protein
MIAQKAAAEAQRDDAPAASDLAVYEKSVSAAQKIIPS